ncbi:MAG: hypothetical protein LIP11_04045 [Clostridiales bacterium]|nr:hypothetical protein [Clostridiales bacterium]
MANTTTLEGLTPEQQVEQITQEWKAGHPVQDGLSFHDQVTRVRDKAEFDRRMEYAAARAAQIQKQ